LEGQEENVGKHDVVFVPAGTKHNFVNIGNEDAKLYTLYAPPEHPDGTVQKTRVGNK
jgi:mannose-6-phosphate isomerase-like protein (cupin superfamily)